MLYFAHRGAVEGTLQPCLVDFPAAHLSKCPGVELAGAPDFERQVHQSSLPGACGDPECSVFRAGLWRWAIRASSVEGTSLAGSICPPRRGAGTDLAIGPVSTVVSCSVEVQAPRLLPCVRVIFSLMEGCSHQNGSRPLPARALYTDGMGVGVVAEQEQAPLLARIYRIFGGSRS